MQKAITGMNYVPRTPDAETPEFDPTQLSRDEVTSRLTKAAANPSLAKSERRKINGYYAGTVGLKEVAHLLR